MAKKLGQHFLANPVLCSQIAALVDISEGESILEIGPGRGALTEYLLEYQPILTVVDIDPVMAKHINRKFGKILIVHNEDILDFDIAPYEKICGNIPYQITGKILERLILDATDLRIAVLMLPESIADTISAAPGKSNFAFLSAFCQIKFDVTKEIFICRDEFDPPPKIDSAVIRLKALGREMPYGYLQTIKAAFKGRKKKLKNNFLSSFAIKNKEIENIFKSIGLNPECRPHEADIDDYISLSKEFVIKKVFL